MNNEEKHHLIQEALAMYCSCGKTIIKKYPTFNKFKDDLLSFEKYGYSYAVLTRLIDPMLQLDSDVDPSFALFQGRCAMPSIAMDAHANREKRRSYDYPKLPALEMQLTDMIRHQMDNRRYLSKKMRPRTKAFKNTLIKCLHRLKNKNVIPDTTLDAFSPNACANPAYLNSMLQALNPLYAILDGCLPDALSNQRPISNETWYAAIELALSICGYDATNIIDAGSEENLGSIQEILDEAWPSIICFGILIHNLHLFYSEAHMKLLYQETFDPKQDAAELKEFRQQIASLTSERNAARREAADLNNQLKVLRSLQSQQPSKNTDVSELVHEHNIALKEKDDEIAQLQEHIRRLENERITQEQAAMAEAEAIMQDKPWLNTELPEENILFIGGHPNLVKKIRELHPRWTFIADNESASLPTKVDAIFVWSAHLSHKLWYRINNAYQDRETMLYVQATNIPRLDAEMKYELWKYLNS